MIEQQIAYEACVYAVARMIDKGSSCFMYQDENNKWHSVDWKDVLDFLGADKFIWI